MAMITDITNYDQRAAVAAAWGVEENEDERAAAREHQFLYSWVETHLCDPFDFQQRTSEYFLRKLEVLGNNPRIQRQIHLDGSPDQASFSERVLLAYFRICQGQGGIPADVMPVGAGYKDDATAWAQCHIHEHEIERIDAARDVLAGRDVVPS